MLPLQVRQLVAASAMLACLLTSRESRADLPDSVNPEVRYELSAATTAGVDLDSGVSGIRNEAEATIRIELVEQSSESLGEGNVYGRIDLDDLRIRFEATGEGSEADDAIDPDTAFEIYAGDITGTVFLGPAYVVVFDGEEARLDAVGDLLEVPGDIVSPRQTLGFAGDVDSRPETEYGGVRLGVRLGERLDIELGAASRFDWRASRTEIIEVRDPDDEISDSDEQDINVWLRAGYSLDQALFAVLGTTSADYESVDTRTVIVPQDDVNDGSAYAWSTRLSWRPTRRVELELAGSLRHGYDAGPGHKSEPYPGSPGNPLGTFAKGRYDLPLPDDLVLRSSVGVDLLFEEDRGPDSEMEQRLEAGLAVNLLRAPSQSDEREADYLNQSDAEVMTGAGLEVGVGVHPYDLLQTGSDVDVNLVAITAKAAAFEDEGDDGLVPFVGGAFLANFNYLFGDRRAPEYARDFAQAGVGLEAEIDLGVLTPFTGAIHELLDVLDADGDGSRHPTLFATGGIELSAIPNTVFVLEWSSGDLLRQVGGSHAGTEARYGYVYGTTFEQAGGFSRSLRGELTLEARVEF